MPLELANSRPNKSLDFGKDGYTGSLSTWHELLQITAPDSQCGLVYVRGGFPNISDSILARAQRRNGRGTFGMTIKIPDDAGWTQEATPAQGMINLRWPCTRLDWVRQNAAVGSDHFASFTVCSFVKDGIVYQIARVVPKQLTKSSASIMSDDTDKASSDNKGKDRVTFRIDIGGTVRFGCPSTAARYAAGQPHDHYTCEPDYEHSAYVLSCASEMHGKRLEMRAWIDRVPQEVARHKCASTDQWPGCRPGERSDAGASLHAYSKELILSKDEATVIVASFSLVDDDTRPNKEPTDVIDYKLVQRYLGVADATSLAPYRLWSAMLGSSSGPDSFELNAVGRAVESIMGVASLPVPRRNLRRRVTSHLLHSADNNHGGNSSTRASESAISTQGKPEQGLKFANTTGLGGDDNLDVSDNDASAASSCHSTANSGVALLKNIMTPQIVDLESML